MKYTLLFLLLALFSNSSAEAQKPNFILFLVDDMGLMDTSVPMFTDGEGNPVHQALNSWYRTPNMERLAARGVRFSNFYAHTVCSPTRTSIMTGQNAARHRTTQFISPKEKNTGEHGPAAWNWEGLRSTDVTLPALMREAGYRTIHIGKAHFAPPGHQGENPTALGFDVNVAGCAYGRPGSYFGEDGYGNLNPKREQRGVPGLEKYHKTNTFLTEALTIEAKAEIDKSLSSEQPFYLYMSHYAVHSPFQSDPRFCDNYAGSHKDKRNKAFATLVQGMDKSLGDLMDHLDAKGIAENTLIIFMSDNGSACPAGSGNEIASSAPLRGKKGSLWEGGTRVPFIVAWGKPLSGHALQEQTPINPGDIQTHIGICYDVFPTIAAIAGAKIPHDHVVDGRDLKHLLCGKEPEEEHAVFLSHFPHDHTSNYFTTYRDGDWKVIYRYFPESGKESGRYALYNLRNDPSESNNLSQDKPKEVGRLMAAMITSLEEMDALYPVIEGQEQRPLMPH